MFGLEAWVTEAQQTQVIASRQPQEERKSAEPAKTPEGTQVDGIVVIAPRAPREPDWGRKLNFDVRGVYAPSAEPYLRQRPSSGCRPMAGGSVTPSGKQGMAGGLVCVKPF
jgi:hypothetical protein